MPGLLTHNNYSIDSVRTSSGLSVTTSNPASDTYTVENGIGTLSGRVIYAVGEVALRGIDQLAIHSKLRLIDSIFPHDDNARIKNMESKYDAVLELSRQVLECHIISILKSNADIDMFLGLASTSHRYGSASYAY